METPTRDAPLVRSNRGGTEPLAALVSVAAICVAFSVYAGFASVTLSESGTNSSETDRAVLDRVWHDLSNDGVVTAETDVATLDPETLPRGTRVAIRLTLVGDDGYLDTVTEATFDERADPVTLDPPPDATERHRPVSVAVAPADIRPGRLTVEVWDA